MMTTYSEALDQPELSRKYIRRSHLVALVCGVLLSYPAAIMLLGAAKAIEIGNIIVLAFASGITVAYTPIMLTALRNERIDRSLILGCGIWLSWLSVLIARGGSIIWRMYDQPPHWFNSAPWGFHIALSCAGALCHLVAPEAVSGRVPTRGWIRIGVLVAFALLSVGSLTVLLDPD